MNQLDHFSIPIVGLKNGVHHMKFVVDDGFFDNFDGNLVDNGRFDVELDLEKKADHTILKFFISGHTQVSCDRCLADMNLDMEGEFDQILKYGEPVDDADELMYLEPGASSINVASFIYECICLMRPMVVNHELMSECDPEILAKMGPGFVKSTIKNEWLDKLQGINLVASEEE